MNSSRRDSTGSYASHTTNDRFYTVGSNPRNNRPTITIQKDEGGEGSMPFHVWRDVIRLSVMSSGGGGDPTVFEFLVPENLSKAEQVLLGGLYQRRYF